MSIVKYMTLNTQAIEKTHVFILKYKETICFTAFPSLINLYLLYIFNRKQVMHNLMQAAAISLMFKAESFAKAKSWIASIS